MCFGQLPPIGFCGEWSSWELRDFIYTHKRNIAYIDMKLNRASFLNHFGVAFIFFLLYFLLYFKYEMARW